MNAAFLLMSSAALVGADTTPAPAAPAAPAVISSGAGCSNCGPVISDCGCEKKPGLLDRIKGKFGKKSCGCEPSCAPPPPPPCHTCEPSCSKRPNLFDTLKSRWGHKKSCGPTCDTCGVVSGCGPTGCAAPLPHDAHPVTPPVTNPPKEMPKPKDPPKDPPVKPKDPIKEPGKGGNSTSIPIPLPPVTGAGAVNPGSPY